MSDRSEASRAPSARSRARDDTRELERQPIQQWQPSHQMEVPKDPLHEYRWVAEHVNGQAVTRNVHMRIRQGYERVKIEELPEDFLLYEEDARGDGYTRYGGLILMRLPQHLYAQRNAYYQRRSVERVDAVNELQGVAGRDAVAEDRGSRTLSGEDSARVLRQMAQQA